jgi:hypothetical protein
MFTDCVVFAHRRKKTGTILAHLHTVVGQQHYHESFTLLAICRFSVTLHVSERANKQMPNVLQFTDTAVESYYLLSLEKPEQASEWLAAINGVLSVQKASQTATRTRGGRVETPPPIRLGNLKDSDAISSMMLSPRGPPSTPVAMCMRAPLTQCVVHLILSTFCLSSTLPCCCAGMQPRLWSAVY